MRKSQRLDQAAAQTLHTGAGAVGDLIIWTVYRYPKDFPTLFVARPHVANLKGTAPLPSHLEAPTLTALRAQLPKDLVQLDRHPDDEPQIVEVWL